MKAVLIVSAALLASSIGGAFAQSYPSRPISMIVPFPAGGPIDVLPRIIADRMRSGLGQNVVVENVPGAGGSLGLGRVARAPADGYTIASGGWGTNVVNPVIYNLSYDVVNDFEPIALLPGTSMLLGARVDLPARNLSELVSWAKMNEDKVSIGTAGIGTASHFAALMFQRATGTKLQLVNYRGGPQALQDLLAGRIDLFFNQAALFFPHMRQEKMKSYAVLAPHRLQQVTDVPTVDEAGMAGFYVSVAFEIPPSQQQTPEALAAFHRAEIEKWWPIVKAANIRGE
jgi:tripartite-type tricarboxylate transporter receptor subunit TctC